MGSSDLHIKIIIKQTVQLTIVTLVSLFSNTFDVPFNIGQIKIQFRICDTSVTGAYIDRIKTTKFSKFIP